MKKVNVSTNQIKRFAGKWIVIDPKNDKIVAFGETLEEISPLVSSKKKRPPVRKELYSFLVPRKGEGPYVLWLKLP